VSSASKVIWFRCTSNPATIAIWGLLRAPGFTHCAKDLALSRGRPCFMPSARHPPRLRLARASAGVSERVHVPLQPTQLTPTRAALPPAPRAGRLRTADHLQADDPGRRPAASVTAAKWIAPWQEYA